MHTTPTLVRTTLHAALCAAVLVAVPAGAHAQASNAPPTAQPSRRIAVLPLDAAGRIEALGFAMSEILARDLAISSSLTVVERSRLDAVLREQGLARTGRVDLSSAPRTGQLIGAERLFIGNIIAVGETEASIEVRSTDVATGTATPVFAERVPLTGIIEAQERIANSAFDALRITLTPAERDRVSRRPTRNLEALVAFGQGRKLEAMGNPGQAAAYYAEARRLDPQFTMAELSLGAAELYAQVGGGDGGNVFNPSSQSELMLSSLVTTVLDQVVRPVGPNATCPPTCAAVPATLIVRIVR